MIRWLLDWQGFPQTRKERIDAAIGIGLTALLTILPLIIGG